MTEMVRHCGNVVGVCKKERGEQVTQLVRSDTIETRGVHCCAESVCTVPAGRYQLHITAVFKSGAKLTWHGTWITVK